MSVDCVVFDLMATLVHDPYREALRAASGMSLQELFSGRDLSAYVAFERGEIDEAAYWDAYRRQGVEMDVAAHHRVRRDGYAWLPGMRELVLDVRTQTPVAVASNYSVWIRELETGVLAGIVDEVIASHDLGCRKPHPTFYLATADRLDVDPSRVLFVDDRVENVDGARAVGMDAVHFSDAPALRAELNRRGLLPG